MSKKQYIIIGITILLFIGVIIAIMLSNKNKSNWATEILNSDKYEITMENCNNQKKELPKEALKELSQKWEELSNNGPWMGNNNTCYKKIIINYEKNNVIQEVEIELIDDTSLVLNINNTRTYYTKSSNINNYLDSLYNSN